MQAFFLNKLFGHIILRNQTNKHAEDTLNNFIQQASSSYLTFKYILMFFFFFIIKNMDKCKQRACAF